MPAPDGSYVAIFDSYRADCTLFAPSEAADGSCGLFSGRPAAEVGLQSLETQQQQQQQQHASKRLCGYVPARRGLGAMRSRDLKTWVDISGNVHAPPEYKHGSALRLTGSARRTVCEATVSGGGPAPFQRICEQTSS